MPRSGAFELDPAAHAFTYFDFGLGLEDLHRVFGFPMRGEKFAGNRAIGEHSPMVSLALNMKRHAFFLVFGGRLIAITARSVVSNCGGM